MSRRCLRRAAPAACVLSVPCVLSLLALPSTAQAGIVGSQVVDYTPGAYTTDFQQASAALGTPAGDTGTDSSGYSYGALTPFNPPFLSDQVVKIGAGGSLTMLLSSPLAIASGRQLGIFVNNGLIDTSATGNGQAGIPAATFSPSPQAILSVSSDNLTYVTLDADPLTPAVDPFIFNNPTNVYTDATINSYISMPGVHPADPFQPFTGHLGDFSGKTYPQMLALLDGSAGGNWIDLSASGLSSVNYVKFEVPDRADYRMVLDAVTAVPEPASLWLLGGALVLTLQRTALRRT